MVSSKRLKRRMIQQAVQENVDSLQGTRRTPPGRRRHFAIVTSRLLFFVFAPVAIFASTFVLSNATSGLGNDRETSRSRATVDRSPSRGKKILGPVPREHDSAGYSIPEPLDPTVLPLALQTIVLDPGHGGENLGTAAPEGLVEKEVTLDITKRLQELLEQRSYKVLMTRRSDRSLSLRDRAEFANTKRGDIFVSIHVNWVENRELRGVETFYLGPTDDPYLEALAARENQESGYSLADFKEILQQVYAGVRQGESRRLAESVQAALFDSLYSVNDSVRDRGVKSAPFGVLMWTEMPAILAEVSCVSNKVEARLLMTPIYRQYIAEALFQGIESYSVQLSRAYQVAG